MSTKEPVIVERVQQLQRQARRSCVSLADLVRTAKLGMATVSRRVEKAIQRLPQGPEKQPDKEPRPVLDE